jgi:hypothetical protein
MRLTLVPLLQTQRELYDLPLGFDRFNRYIQTITGGGDDVALMPLVAMNPMGKPHVAESLDRLIALDAEAVAAAATADAERRLTDVDLALKVGLVLVDDALGGWTNRYLTEARSLVDLGPAIKRGWVSVFAWTGEEPTREGIREAVLASIYRTAYFHRYGEPKTLRQLIAQEGAAAAFANAGGPELDAEELEYTRGVISPHLVSDAFPVSFACLYGDEPAVSVGYPPLGLSKRAGFALAFHDARANGIRPEELLAVGRAA